MEIEDQERNSFEKWLKSQPHVLNVGFNKSTQQYLLNEDQDMWVAWQARAELSLKADARIGELEQSLHWILTGFKNVLESKPVRDADEIIYYTEKLLENK